MNRATLRVMDDKKPCLTGKTNFTFLKPGSDLFCSASVPLQRDLTARTDWDATDKMLCYSTRFQCNSNTHILFFTFHKNVMRTKHKTGHKTFFFLF